MILKIACGDGWRLIDNIAEITTSEMSPQKYEKEYGAAGRNYEWVFLTHYTLTDKGLTLNTADCILPLKEMVVYFKDGKSAAYINDRLTFVMSDEGKTIERIN